MNGFTADQNNVETRFIASLSTRDSPRLVLEGRAFMRADLDSLMSFGFSR